MRIAIVGVSGMLGSAAFRILSDRYPGQVVGSARSGAVLRAFPPEQASRIVTGVDVENPDSLSGFLAEARPEAVINCVAVVRQHRLADDPLVAIPVNAILPHRLARLCALAGARLVHVSTDGVFSGRKGDYVETDVPDAADLYCRSKLLGEVDYPNAITLRTSIVGRELTTRKGLVEWFLSQTGRVRGYRRAIFSGLTTDELVRVIADKVLPRPDLRGVHHVSAEPISKFDLLSTIGQVYGVPTEVEPDDSVSIDLSLNSRRFREATGYEPPPWPELIRRMHEFDRSNRNRDA